MSRPGQFGHAIRARVLGNSGATSQKFYKFTAWAAGLKLDPDIFCMM
jgi:hypothetical protein